MGTQDIEIIPTTPTLEIVLRIEEITLLDVFYSPTHKVVVKRQIKKRKLDVVAVTTPENEPMDIVWKESPIDPSENPTKLSQFTGAYATKTMDKATKVQMLLKEKEQRIMLLEQQLAQEKSNQQAELQVAQLKREFKHMRIQHQAILVERDSRIQAMIDNFKDNPKIDEFINEALSLNSLLMQQKEVLC